MLHASGTSTRRPRPDVVDISVDRDALGDERMVPDALDVVGDAACLVGDRQPVDVGGLGRARTLPDVIETLGSERRGLEAVGEQAADHLVGEELHPAIGVVDDEPLGRAEQLVGDDQRADRVVAGATAGVADDVRVAFAEAGVLRRVEPGIHAGQDREPPRRREGEVRPWRRTTRRRRRWRRGLR